MNIIDLLLDDKEVESIDFNEVFLHPKNRLELEQFIKEYKYAEELKKYGLQVNHKIMLHGNSGCGKTMTAKALAQTLGKKILILDLSNIISSRIGETSRNLKMVFEKAARERAILFLDEFDQLGKERGNDTQDVGEMRRLVNTLIQLMDKLPIHAILIGATNHAEILDHALMRRFQMHIKFELPDNALLDQYYDHLLSRFPEEFRGIQRRYKISFAQAKDYTLTLLKSLLIESWENESTK